MKAVVFDGLAEAGKRENLLRERVGALRAMPVLVSVVFAEDRAGQIYARLKGEAAERVGIGFERIDHSMGGDLELMVDEIKHICLRTEVTGVMIQKPAKKIFENGRGIARYARTGFENWWQVLTAAIDPKKDVDCLTQVNLAKVYDGNWQILPATVKAIMEIRSIADRRNEEQIIRVRKAVVIGRSEIVGRPLAAILAQKGYETQLLGSKTEDLAVNVQMADLVVSATGIMHLIKGDWIKPGAIVIDVGSPEPEVEYETAVKRAGFITPVPYGVGPMTVVSLLENLVQYPKLLNSHTGIDPGLV